MESGKERGWRERKREGKREGGERERKRVERGKERGWREIERGWREGKKEGKREGKGEVIKTLISVLTMTALETKQTAW